MVHGHRQILPPAVGHVVSQWANIALPGRPFIPADVIPLRMDFSLVGSPGPGYICGFMEIFWIWYHKFDRYYKFDSNVRYGGDIIGKCIMLLM